MSLTCIIWPGRLDKHGYGVICVGGHTKAHRLIYSLFNGPIPEGASVLHSCDTPACVNPSHLRVGTPADNARDRAIRERQPKGLESPRAKLDELAVQQIRDGMPLNEAIAAFGIGKSAFYTARNGQTYQDVSRSQPERVRR